MAILYLVRHGETTWNVEGRYQGHLNPSLTERGYEQARATAEQLQFIGVDAIYSSDLTRAYQTAEALAALTGLSIHTDTRLREINQGQWQGILYTDIQKKWPDEILGWKTTPWLVCPPNGERLEQLQARVYAAIDDIVTRHPDEQVAVFTHKLPIALLKIRYQRHDREKIWSLLPANAAWEMVEIKASTLAEATVQTEARKPVIEQ